MDKKMINRVLVVDDDDGTSRTLYLILRRSGYEVETAATGQKALALAEEQPFNLALLDIKLPDAIGTDLIQPLHELQPELEIVIATAHATLETAVRALNQGATAYIHKPIDIKKLLSTIDEVLEKQRLKQENERLLRELQHEKEQLHRRNRELGRLYRASNALANSKPHVADVAQTIVEALRHEFQKTNCSLILIDKDLNILQRVAASGPFAPDVQEVKLKQGGPGLIPHAIRSAQVQYAPDVQQHEAYLPSWSQARSELVLPLKVGERVIGAIDMQSSEEDAFHQDDRRILGNFAERAALAVENAQLFETTRRYAAELEERVARRTEELSVTNARLMQAMRSKDEFLASMSHELRTPLNAILLREEILREQSNGRLDEKQTRSLDIIQESGEHLLALINDILDVAKIEAGKLDLSISPLSLHSVCESSLRLVQPMADKKQIAVKSDLDEEARRMQADGRRLKQVIVNLLSNAIKFTEEGGQVGLKMAGDPVENIIRFTVWDTGIGIAREDMERLFEPFVQADSRLARQYEGSGLGLALTRRVVELHDGGLQVESEVGEGSRFTVSLPWPPEHRQRKQATGLLKRIQPRIETGLLTPPGTHHPTILLAEDNPVTIETLVEYLQRYDYRVIVASTGLEAVEQARRGDPDLILMDVQLPGIDGLEAIRRIRADETVPPVPIVTLTALAMPGDEERCLAAGADLYLSKPIRLRLLLRTLAELLPASAPEVLRE